MTAKDIKKKIWTCVGLAFAANVLSSLTLESNLALSVIFSVGAFASATALFCYSIASIRKKMHGLGITMLVVSGLYGMIWLTSFMYGVLIGLAEITV